MDSLYFFARRLHLDGQFSAFTLLLDLVVDYPEVLCAALTFCFLLHLAFYWSLRPLLKRPLLRAPRPRNCYSSRSQPCKATHRSLMSLSLAPRDASPAPTTRLAPLRSKRSPAMPAVWTSVCLLAHAARSSMPLPLLQPALGPALMASFIPLLLTTFSQALPGFFPPLLLADPWPRASMSSRISARKRITAKQSTTSPFPNLLLSKRLRSVLPWRI